MEYLSHCFDKHSFNELNNIDVNMFKATLQRSFRYNTSAQTSGCFFDVGTNAGSFVKVLKEYGITSNIHCFEPHPILSDKVKSIYPYINMNKLCLSDTSGEVKLYIPEWSCGISSVINRPVFDALRSSGQQVVEFISPCITLDQYCHDNNINYIDFIKIDVEGAEKMVFMGAERMLRENRIKCGIFEIGGGLVDAGTSSSEVINLIRSFGYNTSHEYSKDDVYFYKD